MTTRIRKVITAIDANGNAFSEQHTETLVGDKWLPNDPTMLTDGSVWAAQYNAALEATNAALVSAHKTELDAKEAALTAANATIAELQSDLSIASSQLESVTAEKTALQADNATKQNQLETASEVIGVYSRELVELQDKVDTLKQNQRFDPRQINAMAFYARITKDEFARLAASPDAQLTSIAQAILAYAANEKAWPVVFDSPEMQGMVGYMMQVGELTQERVKQLTADATWQEAFYPQ